MKHICGFFSLMPVETQPADVLQIWTVIAYDQQNPSAFFMIHERHLPNQYVIWKYTSIFKDLTDLKNLNLNDRERCYPSTIYKEQLRFSGRNQSQKKLTKKRKTRLYYGTSSRKHLRLATFNQGNVASSSFGMILFMHMESLSTHSARWPCALGRISWYLER